ncbi:hypothetical protein Cni_G14709 [Canna indica]|uniref:RING-type domain-containing protein n=1 Tax=Canna indica TaxID=4628 RepID=A0AAQ3KFM4_9LILI|nr:hypothetical protein Cni_G14709 [Canna indica]
MPMPSSSRFLLTNSEQSASSPLPQTMSDGAGMMVILSALLCAVVSVAGLALVARCACLLRSPSGGCGDPPDKGLKKKALRTLPKVAYGAAASAAGGMAECPICLAEFEEGDELRVLPQCGHRFHVRCVDAWLGSHSSCPSCRRVILVVVAPPSR